jgi:hypothetical protein
VDVEMPTIPRRRSIFRGGARRRGSGGFDARQFAVIRFCFIHDIRLFALPEEFHS